MYSDDLELTLATESRIKDWNVMFGLIHCVWLEYTIIYQHS